MAKSYGVLVALLSLSLAQASPTSLHLQSTDQQVSLLELYTSEGCSSCPPADRWFSGLKNDQRLWRQVVPVAFHVDYWDDLGWPDRFAAAAFSERQRHYAQKRLISSPYTPGLILNGEEWRGWFSHPDLILKPAPRVGSLNLTVSGQQAEIVFSSSGQLPDNLEIHLAVLGFDLSTQVKAGENGGRTLAHDFVVLGYQQAPLIRRADEDYRVTLTLPAAHLTAPRQALAAWVSRLDDPRPIQTVGGWL